MVIGHLSNTQTRR